MWQSLSQFSVAIPMIITRWCCITSYQCCFQCPFVAQMFQFITAYHLSLLELCFDVFAPMPNQDEVRATWHYSDAEGTHAP